MTNIASGGFQRRLINLLSKLKLFPVVYATNSCQIMKSNTDLMHAVNYF